MMCQVYAIQWGGGGVVAEFFCRLRKPTRFSGGGGSTMNFPLMGPFYMFRLSQRGGPESATGIHMVYYPKISVLV